MASKFIARVPCRFGGRDYKIGEKIPEGVVLEKRVGALTSMGIIEPATPEAAPAVKKPRPKKQPPAQAKTKAAK